MKTQAKFELIDTIGHYNLTANNVSKFKFNEKEQEVEGGSFGVRLLD